MSAIEPGGNRLRCDRSSHGAVPSPFGEAIRPNLRSQTASQGFPCPRARARTAPALVPNGRKPAAENPNGTQAELTRKPVNLGLVSFNQIAARFGVLIGGKPFAQRPDPATDAVARFQDDDVCAAFVQSVRRS